MFILTGFVVMPPRRPSFLKGVPLTLTSTAESIEDRVKRLRPVNSGDGGPPNVAARVGTQSGVASSSAGGQAHATVGCGLTLLCSGILDEVRLTRRLPHLLYVAWDLWL